MTVFISYRRSDRRTSCGIVAALQEFTARTVFLDTRCDQRRITPNEWPSSRPDTPLGIVCIMAMGSSAGRPSIRFRRLLRDYDIWQNATNEHRTIPISCTPTSQTGPCVSEEEKFTWIALEWRTFRAHTCLYPNSSSYLDIAYSVPCEANATLRSTTRRLVEFTDPPALPNQTDITTLRKRRVYISTTPITSDRLIFIPTTRPARNQSGDAQADWSETVSNRNDDTCSIAYFFADPPPTDVPVCPPTCPTSNAAHDPSDNFEARPYRRPGDIAGLRTLIAATWNDPPPNYLARTFNADSLVAAIDIALAADIAKLAHRSLHDESIHPLIHDDHRISITNHSTHTRHLQYIALKREELTFTIIKCDYRQIQRPSQAAPDPHPHMDGHDGIREFPIKALSCEYRIKYWKGSEQGLQSIARIGHPRQKSHRYSQQSLASKASSTLNQVIPLRTSQTKTTTLETPGSGSGRAADLNAHLLERAAVMRVLLDLYRGATRPDAARARPLADNIRRLTRPVGPTRGSALALRSAPSDAPPDPTSVAAGNGASIIRLHETRKS